MKARQRAAVSSWVRVALALCGACGGVSSGSTHVAGAAGRAGGGGAGEELGMPTGGLGGHAGDRGSAGGNPGGIMVGGAVPGGAGVPGYDGCVSRGLPAEDVCATLAELTHAEPGFEWEFVGDASALGTPEAWRCPSLSEIKFSTCVLSEGCCTDIGDCGPRVSRLPAAGADSGGAGPHAGEQLCCYYVGHACGV